MEWFKGKAAQLIALASIVGTLAGFGYTGATYVNRLENLESKVSRIQGTEEAQEAIEERFAGIEVSVGAINKTIDDSLLIWIREMQNDTSDLKVAVARLEQDIPDSSTIEKSITDIKVDVSKLDSTIESLEKQVDKLENKSDNPLAQ
jgi:predicted RNase H-like nuclease (RuvC/YqgF family)